MKKKDLSKFTRHLVFAYRMQLKAMRRLGWMHPVYRDKYDPFSCHCVMPILVQGQIYPVQAQLDRCLGGPFGSPSLFVPRAKKEEIDTNNIASLQLHGASLQIKGQKGKKSSSPRILSISLAGITTRWPKRSDVDMSCALAFTSRERLLTRCRLSIWFPFFVWHASRLTLHLNLENPPLLLIGSLCITVTLV